MKKSLKALILLLSIGLFFTSCHRNNPQPKPQPNQFTYKGNDYELSSLYVMEYQGQNSTGGYDFDLAFFSPGFTVYEGKNDIDSITGSGPVMVIELSSKTQNFPSPRTYHVVTNSSSGDQTGTISFGDMYLDYDAATDDGTDYLIDGGTMDISGSMSYVEIKFSLVDENGNAVTGYYKGAVKRKYYSTEKSLKVVNKYQKNKALRFVVDHR